MEKAKRAVSNFISHDAKDKTTVDEDIRPAVTHEHVHPHQHETVTTAIDKDVHQDHHHTTIQPIGVKENIPEDHSHNLIPVEHKTFNHGDQEQAKAALDKDAAQFADSSVTHETTHSSSVAPTVIGTHTHHHVHEHVQPVIEKDITEPHYVHTTVPIHETHNAATVMHETSTLPPKTMEEFTKKSGASMDGRAAARVKDFEGRPKFDPTLTDTQEAPRTVGV